MIVLKNKSQIWGLNEWYFFVALNFFFTFNMFNKWVVKEQCKAPQSTVLVSPACCSFIITSTQPFIQSVPAPMYRSDTIKMQHYHPCTQGQSTSHLFRLQAHFHYPILADSRKKSILRTLLSCILTTAICFKISSPSDLPVPPPLHSSISFIH